MLDILKILNIPITSKEQLTSILDEEKKFFVNDDEINDFIDDNSNDNFDSELSFYDIEKYKNDRIYDFNGVKISSEKVKRLVLEGHNLYYSIVNNSNLSDYEIVTIKKILSDNK